MTPEAFHANTLPNLNSRRERDLMVTHIRNSDRELARLAGALGMFGGLTWIALAGDSILRPDPQHYRDALFLVPWTLYAVTLGCIHRLQRHGAGTIERWGFCAVTITATLVAIAQVDLVIGTEAIQGLGFPLGVLAWTLGMVAFGAGTVRARVFPRRVGWAIAVSQPLTIATALLLSAVTGGPYERGSYTGAVVHGVMMLVLAAALRDRGRQGEAMDGRETTAVR